jgi:precorrin-2 dehydrogenase/sirohydrochlorin ferrochelatase
MPDAEVPDIHHSALIISPGGAMPGYPINLNIENRRCVVVGGGAVAERKVLTLLEFGARVRVISPTLSVALRDLADHGEIEHFQAEYSSGMVEGAVLIIAATDDAETNRLISLDAQDHGVPVNVVDDPALCTFYVPAVLRRGDLVIGVSTSGKSPSLARQIREDLESRFGEEYGELASILGELRDEVKARCTNLTDRNLAYIRIMRDPEVLDLLSRKERAAALEKARRRINLTD